MPGTSSWQLRDGEQIIACNTSLMGHKHFLIGITRVRNEALILRDTLDYAGKHVDAIVAYDDASTDRTLEILGGHPKVALIVTNRSWEADIEARRIAESRHRGLLLQTVHEQLHSSTGYFASMRMSALPEIYAGSWNERILAIATACGFNCSTPI